MKHAFLITLTALFISSFSSCIVLSTKKYNALLAGKDSLSAGWNEAKVKIESLEDEITRLKLDTAELNSRIAALQSKVEGLDKNYANLRANSSSEIKKLMDDLKRREARLKEV